MRRIIYRSYFGLDSGGYPGGVVDQDVHPTTKYFDALAASSGQTWPFSARSAKTGIRRPLAMTSSSNSVVRRAMATTVEPASTRVRARRFPIPAPNPVTTAVFPVRSNILITSSIVSNALPIGVGFGALGGNNPQFFAKMHPPLCVWLLLVESPVEEGAGLGRKEAERSSGPACKTHVTHGESEVEESSGLASCRSGLDVELEGRRRAQSNAASINSLSGTA